MNKSKKSDKVIIANDALLFQNKKKVPEKCQIKISIRQKLIQYSLIILAVNGFIGFAVYKSHQKLYDSKRCVQHAEQVIMQSGKVLLHCNDIIIGTRGFVITNDSAFLKPTILPKTIFEDVSKLRQLIQDNPAQLQRVDSLTFYTHKYLNFSFRTIEIRSKQGLPEAIAFISTKKGKQYTDQILQLINSIKQEETTLLKIRQQTNEQSVAAFNGLSMVMFIILDLLTILLLIIVGIYLRQNEEKENRAAELIIANKELAFQNEEKEKRAAELVLANKELAFQNEEKEKRAAELVVANKELSFQNEEKEKRADELVVAKEEAEESDQLKTAFLQNISHEIRTPLNAIVGFSALLNEDDISKHDIKEFTGLIKEGGKRLIEIIHNVIDIAKIQTGQVEIKKKPVFIYSIFSDLFTYFKPMANTKNIRLNYYIQDDKFCVVYSDEAKLYQILTNLINNAIKFSESGNIDFGYDIQADFIQFYVKDTGIGIHPNLYDIIFDRFIQVDQSLSREYEGAGLGLAICKGLVGLLGGRIWVESVVNKGTTFFFTLPYRPIASS